ERPRRARGPAAIGRQSRAALWAARSACASPPPPQARSSGTFSAYVAQPVGQPQASLRRIGFLGSEADHRVFCRDAQGEVPVTVGRVLLLDRRRQKPAAKHWAGLAIPRANPDLRPVRRRGCEIPLVGSKAATMRPDSGLAFASIWVRKGSFP